MASSQFVPSSEGASCPRALAVDLSFDRFQRLIKSLPVLGCAEPYLLAWSPVKGQTNPVCIITLGQRIGVRPWKRRGLKHYSSFLKKHSKMSCSGGGDGVSHHVECNLPTCALRSWHLCVNARGKCEVCREDAKQGTGHRLTSKEGNTSRSRLCNWKAIPHIICTRKKGWEMLSIIEFNQDVFRKKNHIFSREYSQILPDV